MQATILQEDLNKALATVSRVVTGKGQLPVLANVLIEGTKGGLVLVTTNLELGLRMNAGGKVTQEGSTTVPARNLSEFVTSLPSSSPVEVETEGEKLKVKSGKFGATFATIAASEFPVIPRAGEQESGKVRVKKTVIQEISAQVAYAAASDESRPVLTGVKCSMFNDQLVFTATDGFRLARKRLKAQGSGFKGQEMDNLILPARTIVELAKIVGDPTSPRNDGASLGASIEMEAVKGSNQVIFKCDRVEMVSRVLEGNFPDVEKIIPTEFKTRVIIDKEELVRAVRAASIFARENNNIIRFRITNNELRITAAAKESGESEVEIEVEKEGEDVEVAFNFRYVVDFLNSVTAERVVFEANGPISPGVWKVEKEEGLIGLIMPVRV